MKEKNAKYAATRNKAVLTPIAAPLRVFSDIKKVSTEKNVSAFLVQGGSSVTY